MKKLHLIVILFLLSFYSLAQNKLIEGKIINGSNNYPVPFVKVIRLDSLFDVKSDKNGFFKISIPEAGKVKLLFSHPEYSLLTKEIIPKQVNAPLLITLNQTEQKKDSVLSHYKNMVSYFPLELLNGSIGLRYERFINLKHSVGLHVSTYLFGFIHPFPLGYNYGYEANFTGFKFGPFYHYYLWHAKSRAGFIEIKPLVGYFHFYNLSKNYSSARIYEDQNYWLAGGSTAFGLLFNPKGGRVAICLSIGYQFFPVKFNPSVPTAEGYSYEYNNSWWFWGGPGSYIEFKFSVGGLF